MCIFAKENFKLNLVMAAIKFGKFGKFVDLLSDGDSVYSPYFWLWYCAFNSFS